MMLTEMRQTNVDKDEQTAQLQQEKQVRWDYRHDGSLWFGWRCRC
jgi:hypothetical protein